MGLGCRALWGWGAVLYGVEVQCCMGSGCGALWGAVRYGVGESGSAAVGKRKWCCGVWGAVWGAVRGAVWGAELWSHRAPIGPELLPTAP